MNIKRLLLAILSLVFLLSATEIHELVRMPLLVKHFYQHKEKDPTMSLIDFLKIHYTADHPNDQDDEEDNDLPFKDMQASHIDISDLQLTEIAAEQKICSTIIIPHSIGRPLQNSFAIFRPPQTV